jgi:hypothetical protein
MEIVGACSTTVASAELIFLLTRSADITVVLKRSRQCTDDELLRIDRGLHRSLLTEGLLFVPASAALLLLVSPLLFRATPWLTPSVASYALIGLVSYGFPFGALKRVVSRIAMNTLREFATIGHADTYPRSQPAALPVAGADEGENEDRHVPDKVSVK